MSNIIALSQGYQHISVLYFSCHLAFEIETIITDIQIAMAEIFYWHTLYSTWAFGQSTIYTVFIISQKRVPPPRAKSRVVCELQGEREAGQSHFYFIFETNLTSIYSYILMFCLCQSNLKVLDTILGSKPGTGSIAYDTRIRPQVLKYQH